MASAFKDLFGRKKFKIAAVAIVLLFIVLLLTTPKPSSKRVLMTEWKLHEPNPTAGYNQSYYGDDIVGEFYNHYVEFHHPMLVLNFFACDPYPYTNMQVGVFLDHDFLNADDDPKLQKQPEKECYGFKTKLLENIGWRQNPQAYYACYGIKFVKRSSCIIE
jgi:hypothetical protein